MCCHPERSEGSVSMGREMLRCAQHDRTGFECVVTLSAAKGRSGWTVKISLVGKQGVCYDRTNKSRNRLARGRSDHTEETGHEETGVSDLDRRKERKRGQII